MVSVTPRPLFTPEKDPVPIVHEAGCAPGPVWTGAENLASTGIRSPDRPACSSVGIATELPGPLEWCYSSFISRQPVGRFPETSVTTSVICVTPQRSECLIYGAA